jgi:acyl-CoA oxidase
VFNAAQDHVLRVAHAHVDRVVLEAFVAGTERCTDPSARALLETVCDLYALSTVEADKGWFLEHGRLTPARSKAVTAAVNELCGELRPHSRTLVDAFAIPQEWLACAILDEEDVRQDATLAEDLRVHGSAGSPGAAGELDTAAAQ